MGWGGVDSSTADAQSLHWNGTKWTQVSTPSPSDGGYLASVAATASGSFVDAAGWHSPDPNERPLIEQGNGQTWKITRQ